MIFEFSSTPNPIGDDLLIAPLQPVDGILHVPDGPGLGITFDEDRLRAHIQ
jgi:D-galactarolactone cycloisomerase